MKKILVPRIITAIMLVCFVIATGQILIDYINNSRPGYKYEVVNYTKETEINHENVYTVKDSFTINFLEKNVKLIYNIPINAGKYNYKVSNINILSDLEYSCKKTKDNFEIIFNNKYIDGNIDFILQYQIDKGNDYITEYDFIEHKLYNLEKFTYNMDYSFIVTLPKFIDSTIELYGDKESLQKVTNNFETVTSTNVIRGKIKDEKVIDNDLYLNLRFENGFFTNQTDFIMKEGVIFSIYLVCFIIFFILWLLRGKDDKIKIIPMFEAPNGMNPLEVGFWVDKNIQFNEIFHMILYWANLGYIKIIKNSSEESYDDLNNTRIGDYTFVKVRELEDSHLDYEKKIFKAFFELGNEEDSKGEFHIKEFLKETTHLYGTLQTYAQDLYYAEESFKESKKVEIANGYDKKSNELFTTMKIFTFLLWGSAILLYSDLNAISGCNLLSVIIVFLTAFLGIFLSREEFHGYMILALPVLLLTTFKTINPVVLLLLMAISILTALIKKKTPEHNELLGKILGFKNSIGTKKYDDKIGEIGKVNRMYFYYVLPYALTLNIDKEWLEKFDFVPSPYWYESYDGIELSINNIISFIEDMKELCNAILVNVNNSATAEKRQQAVEDIE